MGTLFTILLLSLLPVCISARAYAQTLDTMETLKMQYKKTGKGPFLILLPGGLTGWASWDPFVTDFNISHQVVQMQLLSVQYGLEKVNLPADYTVRMESEALAASLKEIGISSPVDFVGWSFGGFVLLDYALNHPKSVRSLTLIEPPCFWILKANGQLSPETKNVMNFMHTLTGDITEKKLEDFMTTVGFAPPGTSLQQHPQWNNWVKFRYSLRNSGQVVMHEDELVRLKQFDQPVLLVKGRGSAPFLHEIIELLDQNLPNAQMVELAEGHAPHIISKDEFLRIIRKFHNEN